MTQTATSVVTHYAWTDSPLGQILLSGDERGLSRVQFNSPSRCVEPSGDSVEDPGMFRDATEQLQAYFSGDSQRFTLKLNPQGTPFQQHAWAELQRIPFGETISYGELARRIDNPKACRAVGRANGANPIPIIIPCHRVIGSTGALVGFTAGLDLKARLLQHETGLFTS